MSLSEDQIHRYARQILLAEVGGTGQLRLLAQPVRVVGQSAALAAAAAYLAAGGSPVAAGVFPVGFTAGDPLTVLSPDVDRADPSALPVVLAARPDDCAPEARAWVTVTAGGVCLSECRACLERTAAALPASGPSPVLAGSLAALLVQQLALGEPLGLVAFELSEGLPRRFEPLRCADHAA